MGARQVGGQEMSANPQASVTAQVFEIYIKVSPQAIRKAITTPEWAASHGYQGSITADYLKRRAVVLAAVALLHVLAIYVFGREFAQSHSIDVSTIEVRFIPQARPEQPPAPPPSLSADALTESRPIHISPPEISVVVPFEESVPGTTITSEAVADTEAKTHYFDAAGVSTRPRPLSTLHVAERYPRASVLAKESGKSVMNICISAFGTVDSVELTTSSGFTRLDHAALAIGRSYLFEPATRDGQPVPVCVPYHINFRINVGGQRIRK
jgi:protein TonB